MKTINKIEKSLLSLMHNEKDEIILYFNPSNTMCETVRDAIKYDYKDNWVSEQEKKLAIEHEQMWQLLVMNDSDPTKNTTQLRAQSFSLAGLLKPFIMFENTEIKNGLEALEKRLISAIDKEFGSISIAYYDTDEHEPKGWSLSVYTSSANGYKIHSDSLDGAINQVKVLKHPQVLFKY